jgi:hypothetical protein
MWWAWIYQRTGIFFINLDSSIQNPTIMTNLEIFFLLLLTSGITIISYKGYAEPRGWPIGTMFESDGSIIKIIGIVAIIGSAIAAFFFVKWYLVLIGILAGWLISGALTAVFRQHTQILSVLMFIAAWVMLYLSF